MILKYINTSQTNNGEIGIKGTLDRPYLTVKDGDEYIEIGSYPDEMKIKDYVSKEDNKFLTNNIFQFIYSNSKIGHSSFKLDEGLYLNIRPDGHTRFNRLTQSLITTNFSGANEISSTIMGEILLWIESKGYQASNETEVAESVNVRVSDTSNPLVTFNTTLITPINPGGVDGLKESEKVWNTWKKIDNDRFMKILPTKTNLGNHIIISDFLDIDVNNIDQNPLPELKVRVKSIGLDGNIWMDTFDLLIDLSIQEEFTISGNSNSSVQVIIKKDSNSYIVKLVWDKLILSTAMIVDAVIYDNI